MSKQIKVDATKLRDSLKAKRRQRRADLIAVRDSGVGSLRNDLAPKLELIYLDPNLLAAPARKVRQINPVHVRRIMNSITKVGFVDPVLIGDQNEILNGVPAVEAAKQLEMSGIPCIRATHLTASEKRIVRLAINRLGEKGQWDLSELKAELLELGSGLIDQSQKMTAAAIQMADMKVWAHRS